MGDEIEHTIPDALLPDAAGDAAPAPASGELPPTAIVLAGKAKDLQALRDAVVDAASVGAGLWFSYLFVLLYLFIAVGSVTHKDLFLQSPVRLPFLNVDLPLLGFFWLGPLIFLIVHAYVLLHFVLLAGKVGDFDTELREQITDEDVRRRLRRQLPSNIFVQFLAGSREVRTGVMGFMLRLIAQINLVIGPIALLVFFQLQFLPYHDWAITWWHRIAVAADIVLLWVLWPSIARGETVQLAWRDIRRVKILALAFASIVPVLLVAVIATFPDEWLQDNLPSLHFVPWKDTKNAPFESNNPPPEWRLASLHELLVAGEIDRAARKPKSLWSNRLVLPGFDAIDHAKFDSEAKIAALPETISLRARHLEGAVLSGAKLRKADFTAAQLQGAALVDSDLRGANFDCADLDKSPPQQCVRLQGAALDYSQLQGASLKGAQLQGASLFYAQLQGASLTVAQLQGALLGGAQLQGAGLGGAHLQGASLEGAQLQGASLANAHLQGASLRGAELQGASLDGAGLQGALLTGAQLQGASLRNVQLEGAWLENVSAWRADAREAVWKNATSVVNVETGQEKWSVKSFTELKKMIAEQFSNGSVWLFNILIRIDQILDPDPAKTPQGVDEMKKDWEDRARSSPAREIYEMLLPRIWRETGCAAAGAPYVLRGLLRQLGETDPFQTPFFGRQSPHPSALAKTFLDEEHCAGAHGLTDDEKTKLKEIRDRSPPPAPMP